MSSKAQGLSLNTIVIAAIVLVVLLILIGITTGYFGSWKSKFNLASATSCTEKGGTPTDDKCFWPEQDIGSSYEDVKEGQKCCLKQCVGELGGTCLKDSCPSAERIPAGDWSCKPKPCCKP